ncbi:hypothetical protein ACFLQL_03560 [Verrucomicrobiota bacterium]
MLKQLYVTTDFYDNLLHAGRHFKKRDIDGLMAYCASLGATRHEWIFDTIWTLYDDDGPVGYDLLAEACESAHRHGMTFHVVFKPFEGALDHPAHTFPQTFPRPEKTPFLEEFGGIVDPVRPFLAAHPEMRMARRPDDAMDPGGRIVAIRLVKNDNAPCTFNPANLSIWTSPRNGGFKRYAGPVTINEDMEQRLLLPYRVQECRVVTLGALDLPEGTRFIMVRGEKCGGNGDFVNTVDQLVELVNEREQTIPSTPSRWRVNIELLYERACLLRRLELTRYGRIPEVQSWFSDRERFLSEANGMFFFGFDGARGEVALNREGEVAIARGKQRHIGGVLCPAYPEVRQHWLDEIRFCLDRGVDGIGIRPGTHSWASEPWAFGFNEPVIEHSAHPGNVAEARRANGEAYGQFIREASAMVRGRGKEFGYHVEVPFLLHIDRDPEKTHFIRNIDWQWERWVREFADYVELRGLTQLREENAREVIDRVGLVAREAGIPLVAPGTLPRCECELKWFVDHPDIAAFTLYESANFTHINENDKFEGSQEVAGLVRRHWKDKDWR